MTANQIAYQQMLADTRKKTAEARSTELANEMMELENKSKKFFNYDIREPGYWPSSSQMLEYTYGRGARMASDLISSIMPFKVNFSFK